MAEQKWWDIEDLEERQKAYEEHFIPPYSVRDDPEEYNRAFRASWELQAYMKAKRRRIIAEGRTCSKCGAELGDTVYRYTPLLERGYGGTRWRTRPTKDQDPICEECAPDWLPELQTRVYRLHMYSHKAPCETCGRGVFFVSESENPAGHVFCSENCKHKHKPSERPRKKTCEVCGSEFVAKRSDARTCSPACRQKSYRKRLQMAAPEPRRGS